MSTTKEKNQSSFDTLKGELGIKNPMQAPKVKKVIVNIGVGSIKDKKKIALIADRLAKITGQKPSARAARMSIATFKLREGDMVGYQVTLRGKRMEAFLDRLINIALPRTKDFRGLPETSIDEMGNYTLGIKEHTIFPETSDEDIRDIFGMAVTIVTSASDKKSALAFFKHLGLPFKKEEDK
jgi:large subunit ribosomal protein L5